MLNNNNCLSHEYSSLPSLFVDQASLIETSDIDMQNINGSDEALQQQPSTSRLNENKTKVKRISKQGVGLTSRSRKNKKRLRTLSETDLRKMKWDPQDLRKTR